MAISSAATSSGVRPVTSIAVRVGQLAQPRQLALGVAAGVGLHALDVAVEQLLEAERRAGGGRAPSPPLAAPPRSRRPRPWRRRGRRCVAYSASRSITSAASSVGWRVWVVHSCSPRRRLVAGREQLGGAQDALACRSGAMSGCGRQLRVQLRERRCRSQLRTDRADRPAAAGRGRRAPRAGTGRCRRRRSAAGPRRSARRSRAWARSANAPAENVWSIGTKPIRRARAAALRRRPRR